LQLRRLVAGKIAARRAVVGVVGQGYVGFPLASGFNGVVSRVAGKRKKAAAKGDGVDKKANVNAAVKMSTGRTLDE